MEKIEAKKKPVCSICIANYNGIGIIEQCIDSVKNQIFNYPFEIIVHDDASTDSSVKYIKNHYPEIHLIENKENVGFCVSNNRMVKKSRGKYILLLNNDAELFPDALKTFYEFAETQTKPGVLGIRQFNAQTGALIDFGINLDPFMNSIPNQNIYCTDVAMVMGACIWIPKTLWKKAGGFPDWFHTMHEDMFISCMVRLMGYPVQVISKSGYKHWVGTSLGGGKVVNNRLSTNISRRAMSERNRIYVMIMCYPKPLFSMILPLHILLLLFEGIVLSLIKNDKFFLYHIYLSAIQSSWQNRKKLFAYRRKVQKKNCITPKIFFSTFSLIPHKLRMLFKHGLPNIF